MRLISVGKILYLLSEIYVLMLLINRFEMNIKIMLKSKLKCTATEWSIAI